MDLCQTNRSSLVGDKRQLSANGPSINWLMINPAINQCRLLAITPQWVVVFRNIQDHTPVEFLLFLTE
jgi:hypothetical protein